MMLLPHVTPEMLLADFWLARAPDPDAPLLDAAALAALSARTVEVCGVPPVLDLPDEMPAAEVRAALPKIPADARHAVDGSPLTGDYWAVLHDRMALETLPASVPVRFGVTLREAPVRALPTLRPALREPGDLAFDRLQETTVDAGWPLAVLHTSADGRWAFAVTPHYRGWLETRHVAFASREEARAFAAAEPFLLAVAPWADAALADGDRAGLILQMGSRLPLRGTDGRLWRMAIPAADGQGRLVTVDGWAVSAVAGWREGFLPPTLRSVFGQAFAALGEPYAWGGRRLARRGRDCSRFVRDVWACVGVDLPRNSGQQAHMGRTAVRFEPDEPHDARLRKLAVAPPGALLFLPGHVMLYLGIADGIPYAIHDLWNYAHPEGHVTTAAQVVVSALPPEPSALRHTLLERLTHIQVLGGSSG